MVNRNIYIHRVKLESSLLKTSGSLVKGVIKQTKNFERKKEYKKWRLFIGLIKKVLYLFLNNLTDF